MKITIECPDDVAPTIRDAIQDKWHAQIHSQTPRGQMLADALRHLADDLSTAIRTSRRSVTIDL